MSNIMEDESQRIPLYTHTQFDPQNLRMSIKTLTHDYYMLELPLDKANIFYKYFPSYLQEYNYHVKTINIAPVARIYGTNQFGQKCCCHVHGYFPYLYVKANQYAEQFKNNREFLVNFLNTLQNLYQRVYKTILPIIINACLEYKTDLYGFHQKQQPFLKIIVYDPAYIFKLRELLDSQVLMGKSFQCYQAHLSYFMHLFSDHNIYGINDLNIIQFSFRKNLSRQVMDLFRKINTKTGKLAVQGFDVVELHQRYPQLFNSLFKNSSCYIQIDIHVNNILNSFAPKHEIMDSDGQNSMDSEMQIQVNEQNCQRKFIVKITRALQQIWKDQGKRRDKFGICQPVKGVIDYSKNIQAKILGGKVQKDPLWINFVNKANNMDEFIQMIRSFRKGQTKQQSHQICISSEISQNYGQALQSQKQQLIQKARARWKYYGTRRMAMIEQILKGERDQLPQWIQEPMNEQVHDQDESRNQIEQQQQQLQQKLDIRSQHKKQKNINNTMLYRNNYKHCKPELVKQSFFVICQSCKLSRKYCLCQFHSCNAENVYDDFKCDEIGEIGEIGEVELYSDQNIKWKYLVSPPSVEQAMQQIAVITQKPYYSNFSDLLTYHKINPYFEPCLKHAQILQRQLKILKSYNRQPITIKNQLKLPSYFIIDTSIDYDQNRGNYTQYKQDTYLVKYQIQPPTYNQVIQECTLPIQQKPPSQRRSTLISISKQDTFVSDLIIFHYQFLVRFDNNCPRYIADPQKDEIIIFSYHVRNFQQYRRSWKGLILVQQYVNKQNLQVWQYDDIYFIKNQQQLLYLLINIIIRLDPDVLVTFDQQKRGIKYLNQRGLVYGINFQNAISRSCQIQDIFQFVNFGEFAVVKERFLTKQVLLTGNILVHQQKAKNKSNEMIFLQQRLKKAAKKKFYLKPKYRQDIEVRGRVNINLYRICQSQLKLKSYTIQHIYYQLFHQQIPQFNDIDLYKFYIGQIDNRQINNKQFNNYNKQNGINFVLSYINKRLDIYAEIIGNLNVISVLVEKSKIYGCDILSMMERGSQFKIQAIMCRVTKKLGYLNLTATKRQVANQAILQCQPLVLEPPKEFFSEPVLLFDFQSLYPSVMIAYNLCYSTCLGNINNLFDKNRLKKLGVTQKMNIDLCFLQQIQKRLSGQQLKQKISQLIFITPNKVAFIKKSIREGVLPRILLQFLISRIMIKNSQKLYDKLKIKKILKDRQYALKLFMNVMFGYTGASFSGRMPCCQIADAIVQVSKYLLRQSIDYLNAHPKYKGKVLYGDTDSIFFHMPGYNIKQAISIGKILALQISGLFPYPIQMKFEKVYEGLFLVAKKRYYGKMYESETSGPKYEGKGVQCIRRDGIALTQNLMRKMLNNLIDTRDLSKLKQLFKQQCTQILNNQKIQAQFILAKEVKLIKYSDRSCPGHGEAAKRLEKIDGMVMPKYGERMKYFVINGGITAIKNRSIAVFEYLLNKNMSLDFDYYLKKQVVPPLMRVFSSLVDINEWIASIEYRHKVQFAQNHQLQANKKCIHCGDDAYFVLCQKCFSAVDEEKKKIQNKCRESLKICQDCLGCKDIAETNKCVQWNCEQMWKRKGVQKMKKNTLPELIKLQQALLQLKF